MKEIKDHLSDSDKSERTSVSNQIRMPTLENADPVMISHAFLNSMADKTAQLEKRIKSLWNDVCERMFDSWELDYDQFITIGEKHGLLISEIYDSEGKHKDMNVGDAEPGDVCWFNVFTLADRQE